MMIIDRMTGTMQAVAQKLQLNVTSAVSAASCAMSGFGAQLVRKAAAIGASAWNDTTIRNAPIFRAIAPGSDPKTEARLRTIGNMIPPERAVFDGVAGLMMKSLSTSV